MKSVFARIIKQTVESIPRAIGGGFAASDGETVDAFSTTSSTDEIALISAHFGVVLAHVQRAMSKLSLERAELLVIRHDELDLLVQGVADGYFVLIALQGHGPISGAVHALKQAAIALRGEMA